MPLKYRRDQSFPLTNDDVDNNFQFLYDEVVARLLIDDFNPESVRLNLIASPNQGELSGIDASLVRGVYPSTLSVANTIVARDANKDIVVRNVTGNLLGNANTATLANRATIANNIDGVAAVVNGGTGATNPLDARNHLRAVCIDGDQFQGKLTLAPSAASYASFNIPPGEAPTDPISGDFWVSGGMLRGKINGSSKVFAFTDSNITGTSANVTGVVAVANGGTGANNAADARSKLGAAAIDSPTFIGSVRAPTLSINENSTRIATTGFVQNLIADKVTGYYTAVQVNNTINAKLAEYTKTTALNTSLNAINTELDGLRTYVDQQDALKLNKSGGTMTGALTLHAAPTSNMHASTKKYVDDVKTELYDNIGIMPVGSIIYWTKTGKIPFGWMVCDGTRLSTSTYPDLFAILGYSWGGSGTTFRLPHSWGLTTIDIGSQVFSSPAVMIIKVFGSVDNAGEISAQQVIDSINGKVSKAGDTMTGRLTLSANPASPMHAATKQYVDTVVAAGTAAPYVITSGNTQYSQSGFTNWVGSWSDGANWFDVYPPAGKTMSNLVAFIPSIAVIHYAGGVDGNDSLRCTWSNLGNRIRVYVQNTEQRSTPAANWLAIWR